MLEKDNSFLSLLLKKLAFTKQVEEVIGESTKAAQEEVWRQIKQTSSKKGGDPITGKGVTKSGEEN